MATQLVATLGPGSDADLKWWSEGFERQCLDQLETLQGLAPWLLLPPETAREDTSLEQRIPWGKIPTLREVARLGLDVPSDASGDKGPANLDRAIAVASTRAGDLITTIEKLAIRCGELADLDYQFLYDKS